MAHNLGVILRKLIGVGKPREWASMRGFFATCRALWAAIVAWLVAVGRLAAEAPGDFAPRLLGTRGRYSASPEPASSTAC